MIDKSIITKEAESYAGKLKGLNHKKTAANDFIKGAEFVLENILWTSVTDKIPEVGVRVLVKSKEKFVNTGILYYNSEKKKKEWRCGNTNRSWDIDFWMPLPR